MSWQRTLAFVKHSGSFLRGRSQKQKTAFFRYLAHSLQESFAANRYYRQENVRFPGVSFVDQPIQISTTPNGITRNFRVPEIHFIHPIDVDNFVEFDGEITFKSEQKLRRYRQKTPCTGGSTTNENDYRQKPAFYGIAMSK